MKFLEKFLHQIKERRKSHREGRTEDHFRLEYDQSKFQKSWLTMENESDSIVIFWEDVQEILAYKRDLFAYDRVCLAIGLRNQAAIEVDEDMEGWMSFIEGLVLYLPGCKEPLEWFYDIWVPPFATNTRLIFKRVEAKIA